MSDRTSSSKSNESNQPVDSEDSDSPGLESILSQIAGINREEINLYIVLLESDELSVNNLATRLNIDRSIIQRRLQTLRTQGWVSRRRQLLEWGGYKYLYSAEPIDVVRRELDLKLDEWMASARESVEMFPEPLLDSEIPEPPVESD